MGGGGGEEDGGKSEAAVIVVENCSPMTSVSTIVDDGGGKDDGIYERGVNDRLGSRGRVPSRYAEVRLADGKILRARHALVATGGMHVDENLAGLLTPRYSYLVALPHRPPPARRGDGTDDDVRLDRDGGGDDDDDDVDAKMHRNNGDSPNFFTLGFSHDWCVESNFVRISGEDHYSGLKRPRSDVRCGALAAWGRDRYPYLDPDAPYLRRYGVYSETSDYLPLVGTPDPTSRVCYMVGCNAWGQASLSALASMTPALLGYRDFRPEEEDFMRLCSIERFVGRHVSESARRRRRTVGVDSSSVADAARSRL